MERLQRQLAEKDTTVSNIARYFEEVVADLSDKSHRDPKTKLLNFDWFMERVESFLAVEQRVRWCGVGVVDINSFKWYNDKLGHAVGDKIIEGVARILADQIRSQDFLASDREIEGRDLHARFGGDEFCFLIPDLPGAAQAVDIAARFKHAVESTTGRGRSPAGVAPGQRRRRRRLPAARPGQRAARRRAQARRRAHSARRQVDVRRQGASSPRTCTRRRSRVVDGRRSSTSTRPPPPPANRRARSCYTRIASAPDGGCSSKVEHRTVAPDVAGSSPVIHPTSLTPAKSVSFVGRPREVSTVPASPRRWTVHPPQ